ncbi:protein lin-37 homolog [Schistocerca nitens]|uniref:protein lin-37 homolog n=1 Tax=Schistocerca nitens TaxID=7011 RepID=UPI002117B6C6|nr:protein lin-37 homolog [Schistocerca nitens]
MKRRVRVGGEDVLNARDRLKGALQEVLEHSDESSVSSQDEGIQSDSFARVSVPVKKPTVEAINRSRTQRKRRRRETIKEGDFHHTYVMKLFDRSVDLAQFKEDAPLYPVCRAWMANQPHNTNLVPKMRTPTPEPPSEDVMEQNAKDPVRNMYKMPPPEPLQLDQKNYQVNIRIPSPLPRECTEDIILDYDIQPAVPKEMLLQEHLTRWTAVRKKWIAAAQYNESRYGDSGNILRAIFKRAQNL